MADALATGPRSADLESELRACASGDGIEAIAIASAFVSLYGTKMIGDFQRRFRIREVRLIASLAGAITHPQALRAGLNAGWGVRTLEVRGGIFHPKLFIFGRRFTREGLLTDPTLALIGSANLTKGGLKSNMECAYKEGAAPGVSAATVAFARYWTLARDMALRDVDIYEKHFAKVNRKRNLRELLFLGVADDAEALNLRRPLERRRPPRNEERAIQTESANVAWAGLESFTGDYTFQVEFPRDAGRVLQRMIRAGGGARRLRALCEDGVVRDVPFGFYAQNSMFRLNVPNETPGVHWAREHRRGLAVVIVRPTPQADCELAILRPGRRTASVIARSVALGTWGRTPTRFYGWY